MQVRADFRQWNEDEIPAGYSPVWNSKISRAERNVAVKKNVEIQRARFPSRIRGPRATTLGFDGEARR